MVIKEFSEVALGQLQNDFPDANVNDVVNLITNLEAISRAKREDANGAGSSLYTLDQWMPNPQTVKELLDAGVRLVDLEQCIIDFRAYAATRQWGIQDNLDAKLIGHIKIMIQSNKLTLHHR